MYQTYKTVYTYYIYIYMLQIRIGMKRLGVRAIIVCHPFAFSMTVKSTTIGSFSVRPAPNKRF